jgi:hypothetical protein
MLVVTGCGGFTASPSISPATFFLPGLGQNTAAPSPSSIAEQEAAPALPL